MLGKVLYNMIVWKMFTKISLVNNSFLVNQEMR